MIVELKRARELIASNGWVGVEREPWCRDSRGRPVHHHDDGVVRYSVSGALQAQGPRTLESAWALFARAVSPNLARLNDFLDAYVTGPKTECYDSMRYSELTAAKAPGIWVDLAGDARLSELEAACEGEFFKFSDWLIQSGRTVEDVLGVFVAAIKASKKTGERR